MMSLLNTVLIAILSLHCKNVMTTSVVPPEPLSHNLFASNLLPLMLNNKTTENIVYSPAAIYTSLAIIYSGAEGRTADELRNVLKLAKKDKTSFASKYGDFVQTTFIKSKTQSNAPQLPMINRLYVSSTNQVVKQFSKSAINNFNCETENVDFSQESMVAENINKWVKQETENNITNIIQPNILNKTTAAILVNAIYFKAKWLHPFHKKYNRRASFNVNENSLVKAKYMIVDDLFGYFESTELNATVLEMRYQNSEISMLIILPHESWKLETLEKKLRETDLNDITSKLVKHRVVLAVPKFRIEFDINLKDTLKRMGGSSIFDENANLRGIFTDANRQKISDIKHKVLFDFSEGGSNVVANTDEQPQPMFLVPGQKMFFATRPFFFVVRNKNTIFFEGHVTRF